MRSTRLLPQGPLDLLRQIILFCGAYWLYRLVRGEVYGQPGLAFAHAADVVRLERSLHVFVERPIQAWSLRTEAINDAASWMYINAHFVVTTVTLAFVYVRRNEHFYFVRNMFMVAMGLALLGYVVFPTAPPRMLPQLGFTDSVADFTGVSAKQSGLLVNPYAAVPSMHVCFALMLGVPMAQMVRRRWAAILWRLYPIVIAWVVIATANHWWADAVLGALTAAVSAAFAAGLFARLRPGAWAWDKATAAAGA